MLQAASLWAIIPARGGSKRLKRKNLLTLAGQSLIARAVKTALASGCFSRVLVSTDDVEIADEARRAGAEVPFMRPTELAGDAASSVDVLLHAVETLAKSSPAPEIVALIQTTSPLLKPTHVREAVELFNRSGFVSLSSMKMVSQQPEWMFRVDQNTGLASPESPAGIVAASALLPRRFIENGAIYLVQRSWLLEERSLYNFTHHGCYTMSEADSIDIDTGEDFVRAEFEISRHLQQDQRRGS
ncbi:MAG: acylneuraminate cytidylyltransferase family protein [Candidatus Riflebacteria bacterium]|nr:acylneuraminate cytidylyltransferase family protein [Candidatus Riflebacteria bacterium]